MPGPHDPLWLVIAFLFGAVVGSFLNVVIYRLPRAESIIRPGSHCPHCNRLLLWWENVPLLSFLALRARCRTCKAPISWRYFWVELATALLFTGMVRLHGATVDGLAFCIFAAALVAAFGIDLEHYIIPDSINTVALLSGVGRDIYGIATGHPDHTLLWGWLPRSIGGAFVCALVFVSIQAFGMLLFRRDAMGDGDVKLGRAIGAMLPLPVALVSFLFAVGIGAVVGGAACVIRARRSAPKRADAEDEQDTADPPAPTPWRLFAVGSLLYLTFADLVVETAYALRMRWAATFVEWWEQTLPEEDTSEFTPTPTQIPFGPFMVAGALLAIVAGQPTIDWYMKWAGFE